MDDARTVIARALDPEVFDYGAIGSLTRAQAERRNLVMTEAGEVLQALAAARLAVVPAPEGDVVEAARAIADQQWLDTFQKSDLTKAIVAALAAEREACAKIAEGNAKDIDLLKLQERCDDTGYAWASAQLQIAAAIRAGGRP